MVVSVKEDEDKFFFFLIQNFFLNFKDFKNSLKFNNKNSNFSNICTYMQVAGNLIIIEFNSYHFYL